MLLAAAVAACAAWHGMVVGAYPGTVVSSGVEQPIDAWIDEGADGRLQGRYVLHEAGRDVAGVLASVGDEGCEVAVFQWTDLYGTGLVRLRFFPERRCFEGAWGGLVVSASLPWHACTRERVTS